jgi:hypothetical protein
MNNARLVHCFVLLTLLMSVAGRESRRPDFLVRVREDCTAGDRWACDLLDALSHPKPVEDIRPNDSTRDDVDAILRGIDRARSTPRIGHSYVPPIAATLADHRQDQ